MMLAAFAVALAAAGPTPPTGNAQGLALLARVHRAYQRVPAVTTVAHLNGIEARFTLVLRRDVVVAEEFVGITAAGTTTLVARGSGPTYAREEGTRCWRRLAPSDRQSLDDLGLPFPDGYTTVVGRPARRGAEWLLPIRTTGRFPNEGGSFTLHVDAATLLVQRETGRVSGRQLTNTVEALAAGPALPSPQPLC
jgi:hypothetical protein